MALIIKADMPKRCGWDCDLWSEGLCAPLQKSVDEHTIDSYCPIIGEIHDRHGDLKDANAILRWLNAKADNRVPVTLGEIIDFIEKQPIVLEATE